MVSESLYRLLVPDAPLHRRTDRDPVSDSSLERYESLRSAAPRAPGLTDPRLHSTWQGRIEQILFAFPAWAVEDPESVTAYRSVIGALRPGTEFVVVHHASARDAVEEWFRAAGHTDTVTYVPLPDYVSFTDWAEDAYVALADAIDDTRYLMEPWEFQRAGDALIADAVEEYTDIQASQAPLIFQGGNCLIGDDFWFLGTDYFADSIALLQRGRGRRSPLPDGADLDAAVRQLFHDYVDAGRRLTLVGTRKPIAVPDYRGRREGDEYFLDLPSGGTGAFQPIFHIDMFVTLVGAGGRPLRRPGRRPVAGRRPARHDLAVRPRRRLRPRSPRPSRRRGSTCAGIRWCTGSTPAQTLSMADLEAIAEQAQDAALTQAVRRAGRGRCPGQHRRDRPRLAPRHLEQLPGREQRRRGPARLPADLRPRRREPTWRSVDRHMAELWEELGFQVHQLADFNSFARRQGVVHCIKKYLHRGE